MDVRDEEAERPGRLDEDFWMDVSERLLITPFRLLCAFVEWELYNPRNVRIAWEHNAEFRYAKTEMDKLYLYWKIERPKLTAEINRLTKQAYESNMKSWGGNMLEPAEAGAMTRRMKRSTPEASRMYRRLWKLEEKRRNLDTDALCMLMRIRFFCWT